MKRRRERRRGKERDREREIVVLSARDILYLSANNKCNTRNYMDDPLMILYPVKCLKKRERESTSAR